MGDFLGIGIFIGILVITWLFGYDTGNQRGQNKAHGEWRKQARPAPRKKKRL